MPIITGELTVPDGTYSNHKTEETQSSAQRRRPMDMLLEISMRNLAKPETFFDGGYEVFSRCGHRCDQVPAALIDFYWNLKDRKRPEKRDEVMFEGSLSDLYSIYSIVVFIYGGRLEGFETLNS